MPWLPGHVQVVVGLADFGLNPQAALDRPRWQVVPGDEVVLEPGISQATALFLKDLGHRVRYEAEYAFFGRGQAVFRLGEALCAASDPRAEGLALAW